MRTLAAGCLIAVRRTFARSSGPDRPDRPQKTVQKPVQPAAKPAAPAVAHHLRAARRASSSATSAGHHVGPHQRHRHPPEEARTPGTSRSARAASGRPRTPARPGRRSSTARRPTRSAASRSTRRTRRPSGSARARTSAAAMSAIGDGVYKSLNGGKTWTNMGLQELGAHRAGSSSTRATRNVVYVAAEGPLWSPGGERGLYKSADGGKTWTLVARDHARTPASPAAELDPSNPDILYAAAYQRRRTVAAFMGGGPESGIYKSDDAGKTWRKLTVGLPDGRHGQDRPGRLAHRPARRLRHGRGLARRARLLPLGRPGRELREAQLATSAAAPARTTTRRSSPTRTSSTASTRWTRA